MGSVVEVAERHDNAASSTASKYFDTISNFTNILIPIDKFYNLFKSSNKLQNANCF